MANMEAVGTTSSSFPMDIEKGKVREFARATGAVDPVYWTDDAPVPPTYLISSSFWEPPGEGGNLYAALDLDLRRVLHGSQEFVFFGPPPAAGTSLTVQSRIESVVQKEGKRGGTMTIAVLVTDFTGADGTLRAQSRSTAIETGRPPA
jgi:hypothetical protein